MASNPSPAPPSTASQPPARMGPVGAAPAAVVVPPPAVAGAAATALGVGAGQVAAATTAVMTVLAAGLGTAAALGALTAVLGPLGVSAAVAAAAWRYAEHSKPATHIDLPAGPAVSRVLAEAPFYQAAYIVNAALRIQQAIDRGVSLPQAVRAERRLFLAHRKAQRGRLRAAQAVDRLAAKGHVWLTWRLGDAAHHTPACRAADGHPFPAAQRPVIGWPGSTHPGCACWASPGFPPRAGQKTVDQVTAGMAALGID